MSDWVQVLYFSALFFYITTMWKTVFLDEIINRRKRKKREEAYRKKEIDEIKQKIIKCDPQFLLYPVPGIQGPGYLLDPTKIPENFIKMYKIEDRSDVKLVWSLGGFCFSVYDSNVFKGNLVGTFVIYRAELFE